MQTVGKILENATIRLDSPISPTKRELLQYLYEQNQHWVNALRLTDQGWLLRQFPLTITGSTNPYPVVADGFSGSYLVTTDPDAYTDGRRREVQVLRLTDFNLVQAPDLLLTQNSYQPDSVAAIAFYNEGGQWWANVKPSNAQGSLIVWYEPGPIADQNLDNAPEMLQQFAQLLTITVACDALPTCKWAGLEGDAEQTKRNNLAARLSQLEARFTEQFKVYIRTINQPQVEFRQPFSTMPGAENRAGGMGRSGRFWGA